MSFYFAKIYAAQGDKERAISYLNRALDEGFSDFEKIRIEPAFAGLAKEEGFTKILDRMASQTTSNNAKQIVEYLDFAVELARDAGGVLKHYMDRDKQVELKGRANLVTVADKEAEALIIGRIRERFPSHAILAEESGRGLRETKRSGSSIRSTARRILRTSIRFSVFRSVSNWTAGSCAAPSMTHGAMKCSAERAAWDRFMNGKRMTVSEVDTLSRRADHDRISHMAFAKRWTRR